MLLRTGDISLPTTHTALVEAWVIQQTNYLCMMLLRIADISLPTTHAALVGAWVIQQTNCLWMMLLHIGDVNSPTTHAAVVEAWVIQRVIYLDDLAGHWRCDGAHNLCSSSQSQPVARHSLPELVGISLQPHAHYLHWYWLAPVHVSVSCLQVCLYTA